MPAEGDWPLDGRVGLGQALGRADAFPAGDLALQRTLSRLYCGGRALTEQETASLGWRWEGRQRLVVAYLFAGLRLGLLDGERT